MRPRSLPALAELSAAGDASPGRYLADENQRLPLAELARRTSLDVAPSRLRDLSVLVRTDRQLAAALALLELDGIARRIVLCPPHFPSAHIPFVIETAGINAVLGDPPADVPEGILPVACDPATLCEIPARTGNAPTEWVLFTSGTTGMPKMVIHTLDTLIGPLARLRTLGAGAVWSTFYDIRRYGGLQILLRALAGGGSMELSSAGQSPAQFLERLGGEGVTHITGTPSHWRMALMNPAASRIAPDYVRMSGEVADQAIIDRLRTAYPTAKVAHAFASTEAGVAFDVDDGLAGFPARLMGRDDGAVSLRVADGSLLIRSDRVSLGYLGPSARPIADGDGFVDTGDMVELHGDRYRFVGRREGIINVGGLKVHPEEVEAVINQHPDVEMSFVLARANPIMGAVVMAEIVARPRRQSMLSGKAQQDDFQAEVIRLCAKALPPYKVPVVVRVVPALRIGAAGKLARAGG